MPDPRDAAATDTAAGGDAGHAHLIRIGPPFDEAPPRFALSLHKCGSTLLQKLFEDALARLGRPAVNIPVQLWKQGIPATAWAGDRSLAGLIRPGHVYTGYRERPAFLTDAELLAARSVLLVRDPRDALVSAFFSFGPRGSHGAIPNNPEAARLMEEARRRHEETGIDDWVLRRAPKVRRQFLGYRSLLGDPSLALFRYETVYFDKAGFLRAAFAHLGLPQDAAVLAQVAARHDILPETENPRRHIRKGSPGDHREKLRAATIARLDEEFAEVFELFGYR